MSKRSFHLILTSIAGLMFVFGEAICLCAQETKSDEFTLEEITVTAQKRVENQQKVAIAMDVITGDQLAESGKTNVDDILASISNVLINKSSDGMRVSVRGLTETDIPFMDLHATTPQVAINVDGAYNSSNRAGTNLFDVERVEVLYGPQSTMYASNSPGGILNVVTAAPKTDKYSVNASAEYGSYSLTNIQFAGNAPIVKDMLAMRLAAQIYKRDAFVSGDTGEDSKSARLKTLFQPNDKFSTTVTINYTKRINGGMMGGQVKPFDYQDGYWYTGSASTGWVKDTKVTDPWMAAPTSAGGGPPGAPMNGPNAATQITKGITAEVNWDTGIGSLSVVPQYSRTTSNDHGNYTDLGQEWEVFTSMKQVQKGVEARMTSEPDFFLKWIMGVNYYEDNNSRYTTYNEPGSTNRAMTISQESKAVFGNLTYPFTDKIRGTAGYRRSWDKPGSEMTPPMPGSSGKTGQSYSNPDYKVGAEYDVAGNSMLYATYATSYRVNALAMQQGNKSIKPEVLKSYTVGAKNRFLDNKLQLNAAAYYYDYTNKSAPLTEAGRQGRNETLYEDEIVDSQGNFYDFNNNNIKGEHVAVTNVNDLWSQQSGAFRTIGVDVSADWVITSRDRVNLGISYLDAKWTDMKFNFFYKKAAAYNNGIIGYLWSDDGRDFSGYTNIFSPKWTITSSYDHNFELGNFGVLVPHIDLQYKTSFVMDYTPSSYALSYQEPYYVVNGSFAFTHSSGIWSFNAYVKNATNYAAKNFWNLQQGTLGVSDPRTFGGVLTVKY
jgi:iron complex outermembrane recepter protein